MILPLYISLLHPASRDREGECPHQTQRVLVELRLLRLQSTASTIRSLVSDRGVEERRRGTYDEIPSVLMLVRLEIDNLDVSRLFQLLPRPLHSSQHRRLRQGDSIVLHPPDPKRSVGGKRRRRPRNGNKGGVGEVRSGAEEGGVEEVDIAGGTADGTGGLDNGVDAGDAGDWSKVKTG
jgi:hypothetical protein